MNINIDNEEKKQELRELFLSFNKKTDIFNYYNISQNSINTKKINDILNELDIPINYYHDKRCPKRFCLCCGKLLKNKQKKFCSRNCSTKYNNKQRNCFSEETKNKISEGLKKYHENKDGINIHGRIERMKYKNRICKFCGSIKDNGKCLNDKICKYGITNAKNNYIYFGFDITTIGSINAIEEYYKVKDLLWKEYNENNLSVSQIKEKYNYNGSVERLVYILKSFDLKLRNNSSAIKNAYLNKRLNLPNPYSFKHGWYENNKGKKIFYRSSYELDYCKFLDKNNIDYEVEDLRIKYYDTVKGIERIAIPDFHLIKEKQITEVKSSFTFIKQNMLDKIKAYKKLGFKTIVRYEGIDYDENEIQEIEESKYTILNLKN
jgi:hypothetical protein